MAMEFPALIPHSTNNSVTVQSDVLFTEGEAAAV